MATTLDFLTAPEFADDKLTEHGRDVLRGLAIGMVGPTPCIT